MCFVAWLALVGCDGSDTDDTDDTDRSGLRIVASLGDAQLIVRGSPPTWAGAAVAAAGDVDGDGRGDLLVGVPAGAAVWLVSGAASGEIRAEDALARFAGASLADWTGGAVAGGADLDGVSGSDLVIGAYAADGAQQDDGVVYVLPGTARGDVGPADAWARLVGEAALDAAGTGFALGDLTGDGAADLVVGAPGNDAGGSGAGRVYVVAGPIGAGDFALANAVASIQGGGPRHGSAGVGDALGFSLALDDVSGDGVDDLGASAGGVDEQAADAGDALVFFGPLATGHLGTGAADARFRGTVAGSFVGEPLVFAGDLDGDGSGDLVVSSNGATPSSLGVFFGPPSGDRAVTTPDLRVDAEGPEDGAGYAVAAVGDVDGDGTIDLGIGAPWADPTGGESGAAYVLLGPLAPGTFALADAPIRLRGEAAGDGAGYSLAGVGDLDGDGRADVFVGAPFARGAGGSAYLFTAE